MSTTTPGEKPSDASKPASHPEKPTVTVPDTFPTPPTPPTPLPEK